MSLTFRAAPTRLEIPQATIELVEARLKAELDQARQEYDGYFKLARSQPDPEHIGPLDEARQRILGYLSALKAIRGLR